MVSILKAQQLDTEVYSRMKRSRYLVIRNQFSAQLIFQEMYKELVMSKLPLDKSYLTKH